MFKIEFKKIKKDLNAAIAVAINVWRLDLSYPTSALYFILAPFIWFAPTLIFVYFMAGGKFSVMFGELAGVYDVITYVTLGSAFSLLMLISLWSSSLALRKEQWIGTFESVYVTPISRFALVLGHTLHSFSHIGLGILMQIVFVHLVLGLTLNMWGLLPSLIAIGLSLIALQAIGLALAAIVMIAKQGWMISELISSVLNILTPVIYPIIVLPPLLQKMAYLNPLFYGTESFRAFLIYGPYISYAWYMLLNLAIIDVLGIAIAYYIFLVTERYIRSSGSINKY